jgi:hypothetical protein
MTIRINQIAVDFTLEKETTLADLSHSLRAWATGQNLAVLAILADEKAFSQGDKTPLTQISVIDVEAVPAGERDLARVAVIARFFSLMAQRSAWKSRDLVEELHQEFDSVRQALFPLLSPIAPRLIPSLSILEGPWENEEALQKAAQLIAEETESLRRELQDPRSALFHTLGQLDSVLESLDDLGPLFQKGRDREGFELILRLFNALEDLNRRASAVFRIEGGDEHPWSHFHSDLQPVLREAEGALESKDYILLTDLIEYELTPRLRLMRSIFSESAVLDPAADLL